EIHERLVGSEMCIRDRAGADTPAQRKLAPENVPVRAVSLR
ncbi:hypothetical protein, partial [Pseudomonas aeruginosa]